MYVVFLNLKTPNGWFVAVKHWIIVAEKSHKSVCPGLSQQAPCFLLMLSAHVWRLYW